MAEEKAKPKAKKTFKPYSKIERTCPKCGPKKRLAKHKGRVSCGKCGYFEKI